MFRSDRVFVTTERTSGVVAVAGLDVEVDRTRAARSPCVQAFSCECTVQLLFSRIEACHSVPLGLR